VVSISTTKPFPGFWALLPTLGTGLLIFTGEDARLNRAVLGFPLFVNIGLLSYPLHLWHWPILTFTRIFRAGGTYCLDESSLASQRRERRRHWKRIRNRGSFR
jgi:peptidoglycan/LPS O-acetylase OafA/YrhL